MSKHSNQHNRQTTTDCNIQDLHTTALVNQTTDRLFDAENGTDHYHDQQTNRHSNKYSKQQNRTAAPVPTNIGSTDSPSLTPGRRSRAELEDNDDFIPVLNHNKKQRNDINNEKKKRLDQQQQQQRKGDLGTITNHIVSTRIQHNLQLSDPGNNVTIAATRYALTRFPFSPFIVRFTSGNVKEKLISLELEKHFKDRLGTEIQISNIRRSTMKCQNQEYDHLIYVKDSNSFCTLFNKQNWPLQLGGENFIFPSTPSFPPQLSLIVKNVDLQTDLNEFSEALKSMYPEVYNVIRLKNKYQNEIKLVKLEILSTLFRDELLGAGELRLNGMLYDIEEYISPATVLICTKCRGIGHFRRQCTQVEETCNVCGCICPNLRQHHCSNVNKCIHCEGQHLSNSIKCPIIKDFRANLTKKLLVSKPVVPRSNSDNQNYVYNSTHYPPAPSSQLPSLINNNNPMMNKMEEVLNGMSKINLALEKIYLKQGDFEQFINDKNKHDEYVLNKVEQLITMQNEAQEKTFKNEKLIKKVILPTLELISKFLYHANIRQSGIDDADFKSQIETKRTLIDLVLSGKKDCI